MNKSIRLFGLTIGALVVGACWTPLTAQTAREIIEKFKAQEFTKDTSVELKMTLINKRGSMRERQVSLITKTDWEDNRKQLIRFLSPADVAGTGFLSIEHSRRDDDNWLYLPALRKSRRIAASDKTDKFMGSEFTYEDLDSEDPNAYEYELLGSEYLEKVDAWIVKATPADPEKMNETGYSRRELWISKDHYLLVQAKYYDKVGTYTKLLHAADIRQVAGTDKWRTYHVAIEDVRKGNKTELQFSEFKIDNGVPDRYLTERYLKRGR